MSFEIEMNGEGAKTQRIWLLNPTFRGPWLSFLSCIPAVVTSGVLAGCGGVAVVVPTADGGESYPASEPAGVCGAVTQRHAIEGATHVTTCSYVDYRTLPPSSGNHFPVWAAYKTYDQPVPEGYWVHDLEHGGIVLSYNCAEGGCASDVAAAQQMIDAYPDDALCTSAGEGIRHRFVMTPDPRLDVRFAASAWGWTLRANCFDAAAFLAFAKAHYGQGTEPLCNDGVDVVAMGVPAGCGTIP